MFIYEQPHQFSDGDCGMSVVKLDGPFLMKGGGCAAEECVDAQHVLREQLLKKNCCFSRRTLP
jgi:hypothetical protein